MSIEKTIHLLLVEDNPGDALLIEEMLRFEERYDFHVTCVDRLSAGIDCLLEESCPPHQVHGTDSSDRHPTDVVLLDLSLPDSTGLNTFHQLRDTVPNVPIVVLTGSDDDAFATNAMRAGAQDYLVKGQIDSQILVRSVNYALERATIEEALRKSEARFRVMIEKNADGVLIVDRSGFIQYVNPAGEELFEESSQDMMGRRFPHPMKPEVVSEIEISRPDGRTITVELRANEFEWAGTRAFLASLRDITARRDAEEEIRKIRKLESVAVLSGGIAHDFNNLLTAIKGNVDLARTSLPPDHEAYLDLSEAADAIRLTQDLVQRFTDISAMATPIKASDDIVAVVDGTLGQIREGSSRRFVLHSEREHLLVHIDREQIRRALLLVLHNAEEATRSGDTIWVDLGKRIVGIKDERPSPIMDPGEYVSILVKDEGRGIPQDDLQHVFDPYFSRKERGAQKGMGLGLTTALSIVKNHGGYLLLDSHAGGGTTGAIYLPIPPTLRHETEP